MHFPDQIPSTKYRKFQTVFYMVNTFHFYTQVFIHQLYLSSCVFFFLPKSQILYMLTNFLQACVGIVQICVLDLCTHPCH